MFALSSCWADVALPVFRRGGLVLLFLRIGFLDDRRALPLGTLPGPRQRFVTPGLCLPLGQLTRFGLALPGGAEKFLVPFALAIDLVVIIGQHFSASSIWPRARSATARLMV